VLNCFFSVRLAGLRVITKIKLASVLINQNGNFCTLIKRIRIIRAKENIGYCKLRLEFVVQVLYFFLFIFICVIIITAGPSGPAV
jgi:hypothetical protein